MKPIKYFSMFSGIGGFEYGLSKSKYEFECVGYSEIDKYAISIYSRRFPNHKNYGDATKINTKKLPQFDFLVGGFPCQSFSISGNRKGFHDTRGTLFFEIARILKDKEPQYFLLENVRNLLSHDRGRTISKIFEVLSDLDYYVESEVYNSKDYGVPQRRERVFLKGYLTKRGDKRKILPFRKNRRKSMELKPMQLNNHKKTYQDGRIYDFNGASIALNARGNNGWYQVSDTEVMPCTKESDAFALTTRHRGMPLRKHQDNYVIKSRNRARKLTPVECERLQAFPTVTNEVEIWLSDQVRKDVQSVVELWHKNQKLVGTVGKDKSPNLVSFVENSSSVSYQQTKKLALKNVHINYEAKQIQLYNLKKSKSSVNNVEKKNGYHLQVVNENFAQLIVGMNIIVEKIIHYGKEELLQNEQWQIHQENGKNVVKLFGNEIMPLANFVEEDLTIMNQLMKYITSDPSNIKKHDTMLTTLYCFVIGVIIGCIPVKTDLDCLEKINLSITTSWTEYGKDGELISDTQRYKCIGNAVTTTVITAIVDEMFDRINGVKE